MDPITIDTKKYIILAYLDDQPPKKIASDLHVNLEDVSAVIEEWKGGYITIFKNETEIAEELKSLARLMKSKSLTLEDLTLGYFYYTIFQDLDKTRVIKLINELKNMPEEKRNELYSMSERLLNFSKYKNIDFVQIPAALDEMVEKGKGLNKEIKEKESKLSALKKEIELQEQERAKLGEEVKKLYEELNFAKNFKENMARLNVSESKLAEFMETIVHSKYNIEYLESLYSAIKNMRLRYMDVDQFLKITDYLEALSKLGFSVSFLKSMKEELEAQDIDFETYIEDANKYIKSKMNYLKEIEELKKEHKNLENQIRAMRSEIKDYFKKVKPKMK
jgi:DNA repair exonuclease SbcCD ATPase subunit